MNEITLNAYGKINLGLDVTGIRDDGYHLVRMIMQTVDLYDRVTLKTPGPGQGRAISISSDKAGVPGGSANIAYRAAARVMDRCALSESIDIHIEKNIPMAAGMAGGSTDAAAVILGMNEMFGLGMTLEKMDEIAVSLGADVPFCLRRGTYLSEGIGEILTKLPDMPPAHVLIVNPPFEVSTAEVYRALDGVQDPEHPDIDKLCALLKDLKGVYPEQIAACMGNILEQVTEAGNPLITEIKDIMTGFGSARSMMTGSGPTVFGLFGDEEKARAAYRYFLDHPEMGSSFLTGFVR